MASENKEWVHFTARCWASRVHPGMNYVETQKAKELLKIPCPERETQESGYNCQNMPSTNFLILPPFALSR